MNIRKIAIASDHAGIELKSKLIQYLTSNNYTVTDLGTNSEESVDYPDYADKVCDNISDNTSDIGILICGSGIGMSMAANRYDNIRAALCHNKLSSELSRKHNDANILVLGARISSTETAIECLKAFLNTEFEGGRHQIRINKLGRTKND